VLFFLRQPEITPAMRGEGIARRLGCFGCHGPEGAGGVGDPTSPAGRIPGWDSGTMAMYARNEAEIREWILYGARRNEPPRPASVPKPLIPMPAYEAHISGEELDDLAAYVQAVRGCAPGMPDTVYEGRKIAVRMGCFGCHGPSGMGGVPNPGSFTGHVPAWDSGAFEELVRNEAELREWILDGRILRLWKNPVARHFLEGQTIPMPAYREHLSGDEVDMLVAYINWIRES